MAGVNAAVVGILASALDHPVGTGAVLTPPNFAVALVAFVLLTVWRCLPRHSKLEFPMAGFLGRDEVINLCRIGSSFMK